jgi:hypothetical protein
VGRGEAGGVDGCRACGDLPAGARLVPTGGGRGANHTRVTSQAMDRWGDSRGDAETWWMDAMSAG